MLHARELKEGNISEPALEAVFLLVLEATIVSAVARAELLGIQEVGRRRELKLCLG